MTTEKHNRDAVKNSLINPQQDIKARWKYILNRKFN